MLYLSVTLLLAAASWLPALRAAEEQHELAVFLFAGQSNMAGADSFVGDPPGFRQTEADQAALFTTAPLPKAEEAPEYYPWGDIRGHRASPGGTLLHGPEVGFARELYGAGWRSIAIIKVSGNFARDADRWPWGPERALYAHWTKFVDARLVDLQKQGYRYRVAGFVWHQGIDDAIQGQMAASYQQNLTGLVGALRHRYGHEGTPFVLARSVSSPIATGITGSGEKDPMAVVRRAQVGLGSSLPHAGWIDVDDLPTVNQHHFTAEGQLTIGRRFAREFLRLIEPRP
jgi:hypothetical protein